MTFKQNRKQKKIIIFIILSLLIHLGLLVIPWSKGRKSEKLPLIVERIILPEKSEKQMVDDTKQANKETPKDSAYLSKENNAVSQETKAKEVGKTENSPKVSLISPTPPSKNEEPKSEKKKTLSMADLGLKMSSLPPSPQRKPTAISSPSKSQTDDYLPNVKSGLETSLNTREFKFYSYFERIKDRLRMYWEPQLKQKVRQLYAKGADLPNLDLMTRLEIVLNKNGELSKIKISRNSGVEEIDEAATKAFELAAPFPNPPSGMVENNGEVHLTWSFVVQTSHGISDIFVFLSKR